MSGVDQISGCQEFVGGQGCDYKEASQGSSLMSYIQHSFSISEF